MAMTTTETSSSYGWSKWRWAKYLARYGFSAVEIAAWCHIDLSHARQIKVEIDSKATKKEAA